MLFAGSILDRAPGRTYTGVLRFAELSLRAPLPRPGTLTSWRAGLPEGFKLALRAPKAAVTAAAGPLRMDAGLEAALQWTLDAAQALDACAVVIATPADLMPGARSRELLKAYVDRLPRVAGRHYVWAPSGAWEPEEAEPVCDALGLLKAFDPLESRRPGGEVVYATLRAIGHRSTYSQAALEDALEAIEDEPASEAYISVEAERAFDIAKRLQRLAAERGMTDAHGEAGDDEADEDEGDEDEDLADEDEDDQDQESLDDES